MSMTLSMTEAQLEDPAAMAEFLRAVPNGDRLAALLIPGAPIASRAYDDDTWTARFVASDGRRVRCFAVSDVTIDQAEMIAALGVEGAADSAEFRDLVAQALGPTFDPSAAG